jgi:RHS repeat-associated protein
VFSKVAGQWTSGGVSRYGLPFLWKAVRLDEVTGLLQMRNRCCSVETGRFLTRDPIGVWGDGLNHGNEYGYAASRPSVFGDPLGQQGLIGGLVGGIIGAVTAYATGGSVTAGFAGGFFGGLVYFGAGLGAGAAAGAAGGAAGKAIENICEGKPITEGCIEAAATGAAAVLLLDKLSRAGRKLLDRRRGAKKAIQENPPAPPEPKPGPEPVPPTEPAPVYDFTYEHGLEDLPLFGQRPNLVYVKMHSAPRNKAIQSTIYNQQGTAIGHVDWQRHGSKPPGHGHIFEFPGDPSSGHAPGQGIPPNLVPPEWRWLPPGASPIGH